MSIFAETTRFGDAIATMNEVTSTKFPLLLDRIIKKLHLQLDKVFSDAESEKLCSILGIDSSQLDTIMDSSAYIFEQAAYHGLTSESLGSNLTASGLDELPVSAFQKVWELNSADLLGHFRDRVPGVPRVLTATDWQLRLSMSSSDLRGSTQPSAVMNFTTENSSKVGTDAAETEAIGVQFNPDQLFDFFDKLETIQEQLDALG